MKVFLLTNSVLHLFIPQCTTFYQKECLVTKSRALTFPTALIQIALMMRIMRTMRTTDLPIQTVLAIFFYLFFAPPLLLIASYLLVH